MTITPRYGLDEVWMVLPYYPGDRLLDILASEIRHSMALEYLVHGRLGVGAVSGILAVSLWLPGSGDRIRNQLLWDSLRSLNEVVPPRRWWPLYRAIRFAFNRAGEA